MNHLSRCHQSIWIFPKGRLSSWLVFQRPDPLGKEKRCLCSEVAVEELEAGERRGDLEGGRICGGSSARAECLHSLPRLYAYPGL